MSVSRKVNPEVSAQEEAIRKMFNEKMASEDETNEFLISCWSNEVAQALWSSVMNMKVSLRGTLEKTATMSRRRRIFFINQLSKWGEVTAPAQLTQDAPMDVKRIGPGLILNEIILLRSQMESVEAKLDEVLSIWGS